MKIPHIIIILVVILFTTPIKADDFPTIHPSATFTKSNGEIEEGLTYNGSAPLNVQFTANAENTEGWDAHYEWRFFNEKDRQNAFLIRYDENTNYPFIKAGTFNIKLYATFTKGNDLISYTEEYWKDNPGITISILESKLEFPNAFSPNGDGINDVYKAKEGYQSIVEFHAYIFNRWGVKIYEWDDPANGWNGTYKGRDVKDGVYFLLVKAKGADGHNYSIKKDINLLRGYSEQNYLKNNK